MGDKISIEQINTLLSKSLQYNGQENIIKLDTEGQIVLPEIYLLNKGGRFYGNIENAYELKANFNMNSADEISFSVDYKQNDNVCKVWSKLDDFKVVYIPSFKQCYEITVNLTETDAGVATKTIIGTSLCESELGQIMIYGTEINTEDDLTDRLDRNGNYVRTEFYSADDASISMLDRVLEKAPYYVIKHVDQSLIDAQKLWVFSFDNTSIYDALNKIAEEANCLFLFGSNIVDGKIQREIYVYDLMKVCKSCGKRGEFETLLCPECGSDDVQEYGDDTNIYVTVDNLTDNIKYSVETGSVKNCFKLQAGDDLMTATIMNCNPNGTGYLWYFSNDVREEMSDELQLKLGKYDIDYNYYNNTYKANIDSTITDKFNKLVDKYKDTYNKYNNKQYYEDDYLKTINHLSDENTISLTGYQNLIEGLYECIDFYSFLKTTMMPNYTFTTTTAEEQVNNLITGLEECNYTLGVSDLSSMSKTTIQSTIKSFIKVYVDSSKYNISFESSDYDSASKYWQGVVLIKSYADDDTTDEENLDKKAVSLTVYFTENTKSYIKQKLDKILADYDEDRTMDIVGLFNLSIEPNQIAENTMPIKQGDYTGEFVGRIQMYCLDSLNDFYQAADDCINIMTENSISDEQNLNIIDPNKVVYNTIYMDMVIKQALIGFEIQERENEMRIIQYETDENGNNIDDGGQIGLKNAIQNEQNNIASILDMETYLGKDLWYELLMFRREQLYQNSNYVSDGLNNSEIIDNAKEFLDTAQNELIKSATAQYKIESDIKNLLILDEFKPLVSSFKLGNWIRIFVNNNIYRLRIISYDIDFDNLENIDVTFSNIIRGSDYMSDVQSILQQAKSMATSYSVVSRQASQAYKLKDTVNNISNNGLTLSDSTVLSTPDGSITISSSGIVCKTYDKDKGEYSSVQLKILGSGIYATTDNWQTSYSIDKADVYTLPEATKNRLGGIKVGDNLEIKNGVLSAIDTDTTYSVVTAKTDGLMSASDKVRLDSINKKKLNLLGIFSTSSIDTGMIWMNGSTGKTIYAKSFINPSTNNFAHGLGHSSVIAIFAVAYTSSVAPYGWIDVSNSVCVQGSNLYLYGNAGTYYSNGINITVLYTK